MGSERNVPVVLLLGVLCTFACRPVADDDVDGGVDDGDDAGPSAPDCGIELVVLEDALGPQRVYALTAYRGEDVALLVDTGSQVTFISTPAGSPDVINYDQLTLGCEEVSVAGRGIAPPDEAEHAGRPLVGFLGADYFQAAPTRLDVSARRITRVALSDVKPDAAALLYTDVFGFMFVDVILDGEPLTLGFDTGAPDIFWVGVDGQPGDQVFNSVDGLGNPVTLHFGTGTLEAGGPPVEVPVMRTLEYPSLTASNEQMGVDAQGLFGLTALPGSSFVLDAATATIWLE